ncbi:MAG: hypothetical protein OXH01_01265 [Bacteroidetes bacterium]|nr:hypothetical protein [Bacteroidota bacterium]
MPNQLPYAMVDWPRMTAHIVQQKAQVSGPVIAHENGRAVEATAELPNWHSGMPLKRARRLYEEITFLPRDRVREQSAHIWLARQLVCFSPYLKPLRTGCFLIQKPDIDPLARFIGSRPYLRGGAAAASEWAHLSLCGAVGGALHRVCDSGAFLSQTPVDVLADPAGPLGPAGLELAERLHLFGLHDLGVVKQRLSRKHLRNQFGVILGGRIDELVRPGRQPNVPGYVFPQTLHTSHEFDTPLPLAHLWIRRVILHLAEHLADALEHQSALALTLQAFIPGRGMAKDRYLSRRGLYSVSDLRRCAMNLYNQLSARLMAADVLSLRLVASMLITRACVQQSLFTSRNEATELTRAVGLLQQRYGPQTILHVQRKDSIFVEDRLAVVPVQQQTS